MEGLNRQEVEYRENNGLSNEEKVKYTRTTKQIILSNTITLFNILNIFEIFQKILCEIWREVEPMPV